MKNLIYVIAVLTISNANAGVPLKYFKCPDLAIKEPSQSQGYFMDESCKVVYVKPPIEGEIKYNSIVTSTASDCESTMAIVDSLNSRIQENVKAENELRKANKNVSKNSQKIVELQKKCDKPRYYVEALKLKSEQAENKLNAANEELVHNEEGLRVCADSTQDLDCDTLNERRAELIEHINEYKIIARNANYQLIDMGFKLKSCESLTNYEIERIRLQDKDYVAAVASLETTRKELKAAYDKEAAPLFKKGGGQLSVGLYSRQNKLVQEFKQLNPIRNLEFRPIPLQKALIHFDKVTNGVKDNYPIQLRSNINGLTVVDSNEGTKVEDIVSEAAPAGNIGFGEGAGGNIIINKYAACSILKNAQASSQVELLRDIANSFKPTVTFLYDVQVERKVDVKYKETHLYQLIKSSQKKSRLFKSSTATSITEKSEAEKWIDVQIDSEDQRLAFEDREKLAMDIREEFLDAALKKVAVGYLTTAQAELIEPGPDGATKSAKELRENCPHLYCQFAAIALNIGSALFGGSSATSNMKQTVLASESQHLSDKATVREFGQQTLEVVRD